MLSGISCIIITKKKTCESIRTFHRSNLGRGDPGIIIIQFTVPDWNLCRQVESYSAKSTKRRNNILRILSGMRGYCLVSLLLHYFIFYICVCNPGPAGTTLIRVLRLRSSAIKSIKKRKEMANMEYYFQEHTSKKIILLKLEKHTEARYRHYFIKSKGIVRYKIPKIQKISKFK